MGFYDKYNSDDKVSEFNEAALKMMRLDRIQDMLNEIRNFPLAYNVEIGRYNYEVMETLIESLYHEVRPKMNKSEKKKGDEFLNEIESCLFSLPPHEKKRQGDTNENKLNRRNWKIVKRGLRDFENFVRDKLDTHGFGSPEKDDLSGL